MRTPYAANPSADYAPQATIYERLRAKQWTSYEFFTCLVSVRAEQWIACEFTQGHSHSDVQVFCEHGTWLVHSNKSHGTWER